jgi:glycosyltransferase involved in cell wall biosynthesis
VRVGIDLRYRGDAFPGIGRYSDELVRALTALPAAPQLVLFSNQPAVHRDAFPHSEIVAVRSGPFSLSQQAELPLLARRSRLDLLHSPYFVKPYLLPCPSLLTIFDLLPLLLPATLSPRGRRFYRLAVTLAARTSRHIVTASASARADLEQLLGVPPARISVIPLAAADHFRPQPAAAVTDLRRRLQLPDHYLLFVGANKAHKNLDRLLQAFQLIRPQLPAALTDCRLVIAGPPEQHGSSAAQLAARYGLQDAVQVLHHLPAADLPALYSGALLLAFPSSYEGFGLPPLEAMACDTPVLCSYAGSLPEVVADAALSVDPHSRHEIADGLLQLLTNPLLRARLQARGRIQAARFSWQRTAVATRDLYQRLIEQPR